VTDAPRTPPALRLPRWHRAVLVVPPLVFLAVFYVWPFLTLVIRVIDGSTVADTLRRPGLGRVLWFTTWQAVISTVATLVAGMLPAYLLARWSFPGRRLLTALVTVPFLLPTVVVGAAFIALLPDAVENSALAVVLAHVFFNVAVVVRVVGGVWAQVPADLISAARTLGAGPLRATREITLPLLRPALVAAGSIAFLFTFTSFGVVQILGGPARVTLEVEIARRATQLGDVGGAAVLSVLQLAVLAVIVSVVVRVQRRSTVAFALDDAVAPRPRTPRSKIFVGTAAIVTFAAVSAPLLALAAAAFRPGGQWSLAAWRAFGDAPVRPGVDLGVDAWSAVGASLRAAVIATAIAVSIGTLASLAIASARAAGRLLDVGSMLPLGTSAVTIGFGMLITFDRSPFDWRGAPWLVAVGHALVAMPFVVRATLPVLRARPTGWREAAAVLGASPSRAWWEIDVRLLRRPLLVATCFAAAISLGEFGATTFLSRSGAETLPIAIARLLGRAGDIPRAQASALALVLAAVTLVVLVLLDSLGGLDGQRNGSRDAPAGTSRSAQQHGSPVGGDDARTA
jgi:thiamine transport system permease protein